MGALSSVQCVVLLSIKCSAFCLCFKIVVYPTKILGRIVCQPKTVWKFLQDGNRRLYAKSLIIPSKLKCMASTQIVIASFLYDDVIYVTRA